MDDSRRGRTDLRATRATTVFDAVPLPAPDARASRRTMRLALAAATMLAALCAWLALRGPQGPAGPPRWDDHIPDRATPLHSWKWIVIHHSAGPRGTVDSIDRHHHDVNGWDGIGYHFVIGNGNPIALGAVEATYRWRGQQPGAHAGAAPEQAPYNRDGIGVCLIGDFRSAPPDERQLLRTAELCAILIHQFPSLALDRIVAHRDVPSKVTACPGQVSLERLRFLTRHAMEQRGWHAR